MSSVALPFGPDFPWLAPLAGFSDLPFRLLCREHGAAVACTEMISAKGLVYSMRGKKNNTFNSATEELLGTAPADKPLVVQLFGAEPDFLQAALETLRERGYTHFDLNMGCSVRKVTKTGAGSALLRELNLAMQCARAMLGAAAPLSVGFKLRLGWDAGQSVYLDLAQRLEDAGAGWICLHPRYARQGFSGQSDTTALEKLAKVLTVPLIASGDLFTAEDGLRILQTGASAPMFARGALSEPDIFNRYLNLRQGTVLSPATGAELKRTILRHAALARLYLKGPSGRRGIEPALLKMRTAVPRYVRHLQGVKTLRQALIHCESWDEFYLILDSFFGDC